MVSQMATVGQGAAMAAYVALMELMPGFYERESSAGRAAQEYTEAEEATAHDRNSGDDVNVADRHLDD